MKFKKSLSESRVIFLITLKIILSVFLVINNYFYNVYAQGTLSPTMDYKTLDENIQYLNTTINKQTNTSESVFLKVLDYVGLRQFSYIAQVLKQIIEYVFVTFSSFLEIIIKIIFPTSVENLILNSTLYKIISILVMLLDLAVTTYVLFIIIRSFAAILR